MQYLISAVIITLFVVIVKTHPICRPTIDISEPTCHTNLTTNTTFLNEWLSLHHKSEGIDQLRRRNDKSIASILLSEMVLFN